MWIFFFLTRMGESMDEVLFYDNRLWRLYRKAIFYNLLNGNAITRITHLNNSRTHFVITFLIDFLEELHIQNRMCN